MKLLHAACISAFILFPLTAHASIVQVLPGGTPISIPASNSTLPQTIDGITITSNAPSALFGYTGSFDFGGNGIWSGTPMINVNTGTVGSSYADVTFTFEEPVKGVLAELNWRAFTSAPQSVNARIYDESGQFLEFINLANNGGANTLDPGYWGFLRDTADIKTFVISNGFIGARNISVLEAAAVPEPATWATMMMGLAMAGGALRRERRRYATPALA